MMDYLRPTNMEILNGLWSSTGNQNENVKTVYIKRKM